MRRFKKKGDKQTEQGRHGDDLLGVAYGPDISGFCVVRGTVDPADGHSNITQVVPPCQESWRRSPYERTDLLGEDNWQVGVSLSGLADGERHTIRCKVVDPGAREEHQALGGELLLEARFEALDQYDTRLKFSSLPYEKSLFNQDSILREKRDRWHKELAKDVYLEEAIAVLKDLKRYTYNRPSPIKG